MNLRINGNTFVKDLEYLCPNVSYRCYVNQHQMSTVKEMVKNQLKEVGIGNKIHYYSFYGLIIEPLTEMDNHMLLLHFGETL